MLDCKYFTEDTKILFTACKYIKFQKLMSAENLKLKKQLSRFISIVLSKF